LRLCPHARAQLLEQLSVYWMTSEARYGPHYNAQGLQQSDDYPDAIYPRFTSSAR
jgi:hypothetical protein